MATKILGPYSKVVQVGPWPSDNYNFIPFTAWVPALSARKAQWRVRLRDSDASLLINLGYQWANTDPSEITSQNISADVYLNDDGDENSSLVDLSAIDDAMWVRFGIYAKARPTATTDHGHGEVEVTIALSES